MDPHILLQWNDHILIIFKLRTREIDAIIDTGSVESFISKGFIIENYFDIRRLRTERSVIVVQDWYRSVEKTHFHGYIDVKENSSIQIN